MKHIRIAIDGPSGAGKSTLARSIAAKLGYVYVDTGAIYRTISCYMLERELIPRMRRRLWQLCPRPRWRSGMERMGCSICCSMERM